MGYAKYHEDNIKINDDRKWMNDRCESRIPSVSSSYSKAVPKKEGKFFCPFCDSVFREYKNLINHVLKQHGGVYEFIYLNNQKIDGAEQTVKQVFSLKLYSFRDESREVQLLDNIGNRYSFWTQKDRYEYDLNSILKTRLYSEIQIKNIDLPVRIKQQLDINAVSIDKVISGKYQSYLFDEQLSEGKLTVEGCLIYIKMLIYERTKTDSFIECIDQLHLDNSRVLQEIYYYHFLNSGSIKGIEGKLPLEITMALCYLLNGKYQKAETVLSGTCGHSNDKFGCQLILSLLKNDKLGVAYLTKRYEPFGIIGILEKILYHYANYEPARPVSIDQEFDELRLFLKYPLIQALIKLNDSINDRSALSYGAYSLLRELTPIAAIHYCNGIDASDLKERITKSISKIHKDSTLIKEYSFKNGYAWIKRRISISDGILYKEAVLQQNESLGNVFSQHFIENFPFDDQIKITPLGGEHEIGANCFVISYKGYNILLDCGINVQKCNGAYPVLDAWNKGIDAIIISHAHIDHSGGVPKAHAMWPNANIIMTTPTKVFLKYLYSDMAKVKNGIVDEFELENVKIEKNVMFDTLNAINTLDYGEWFYLDEDIKIRLHSAGHIIGAAMIELAIAGKTLIYTGDYCNYNQILTGSFDLHSLPQEVDYLITESTYIKKSRVDWNRQYDNLKDAILKAVDEKGAILLPAASIGRSQELVCLLGEMKLSGELSNDISLFIAGMAIPATTQIVPFMNERYEEIIGAFEEIDGQIFPEGNAIVVASSGSMSKGSASHCIAKNWDNRRIKYTIIANDCLDKDAETDRRYRSIQQLPLSNHADLRGMFDLIERISPKVISFIHRGSGLESDIQALVETCKSRFSNDILYRDLKVNRTDKIFDMYECLMEGVSENG